MLCAISEETPQEPVVSIKSGHVFEKRLIEKHIKSTGACPVTREPLALDDLMPLRVKAPFKPRPATLSSVPALLQTMQNEWDAVMLETYEVKQQLIETRKNLAQALYENDAAFRVIARLIKERDDAKHMLLQVRGAAPVPAPVQASAMIRESQSEPMQGVEVEVDERDEGGMTPTVLKKLEDAHTALSKGRKKRVKTRIGQVARAEDIKGYTQLNSFSPHSSTQPGILCLALHPVRSNLVATGGNDGSVLLCDRSGKIVDTLKAHRKKVNDVAFVNDFIISASSDHKAIIWAPQANSSNYTARHTIACHTDEVVSLAVHPCNEFFATASTDKSWAFHDVRSGRERCRSLGQLAYTAIQFHPDGKMLGACTVDNVVSIADLQSMAVRAQLTGHSARLTSLAFSENGYYLATGDEKGSVKLWDLRKVECFKTIQEADFSSVHHLAFDGSGSFLSVAGSDIRIFSTADWSRVGTYKDHRAAVTSVAFSETASFFASCSLDRTVKLWGADSQ